MRKILFVVLILCWSVIVAWAVTKVAVAVQHAAVVHKAVVEWGAWLVAFQPPPQGLFDTLVHFFDWRFWLWLVVAWPSFLLCLRGLKLRLGTCIWLEAF